MTAGCHGVRYAVVAGRGAQVLHSFDTKISKNLVVVIFLMMVN